MKGMGLEKKISGKRFELSGFPKGMCQTLALPDLLLQSA